MSKKEIRKNLAADVAAFIAAGNAVTSVPAKRIRIKMAAK